MICGGGVIGACTAWSLARRGVDLTVVERTGIACAASGNAGGFLALDWCGGSPLDALALAPADVDPDPDVIERLRALCERLSPAFTRERIIATQACFRPITRDFMPLIGRVPHTDGAFVATGHNVWGILNGPATGEAMAELIVDGKARTIDLKPFDPGRLSAG